MKVYESVMNDQEIQILDILQHFWFVKSYLTHEEMQKCLCQLMVRRNPFLTLKKEWEKRYADCVNFDAEIFFYKLENDS